MPSAVSLIVSSDICRIRVCVSVDQIEPFVDPDKHTHESGYAIFNSTNPTFYVHAGGTHFGYTNRRTPEQTHRNAPSKRQVPTLYPFVQRGEQIVMTLQFLRMGTLEGCARDEYDVGGITSDDELERAEHEHVATVIPKSSTTPSEAADAIQYVNTCRGFCFPKSIKVWSPELSCMTRCCEPLML